MESGIYRIVNTQNQKSHVGQTKDLLTRQKQHFNLLRRTKHHNVYLQNAWNKYGQSAFIFEILERCIVENLDQREWHWIHRLDTLKQGYNLTDQLYNGRRELSQETREKMSEARRGPKHYNYGQKLNKTTKEKLSKAAERNQYQMTHPNGQITHCTNLHAFCKEHQLNPGHLYRTAMGQRNHHKGYKALIVKKL